MNLSVFFYGLYMDAALLESMGFHPRIIGPARLDDYRLQIGERATLIPAPGTHCYGLLHELPEDEVAALYSRPEVSAYVPITVDATLLETGAPHSSACYVLSKEEANANANTEYAARLADLLNSLGLPSDYVGEVRQMSAAT